jgi:hypothetical protein
MRLRLDTERAHRCDRHRRRAPRSTDQISEPCRFGRVVEQHVSWAQQSTRASAMLVELREQLTRRDVARLAAR